jgi:hypothetical protein
MRIQEKLLVLLSEDLSSDPKQIRFKSETDSIDVSTLIKSRTIQEILPIGVNTISLGNITQGRYLYVRPKNACVITIDGQSLTLRAAKVTTIWADFTLLTMTISSEPNDIVLVIAGD